MVGPNPTDRGKPGSKHHLLTDRNGVPLAVMLTATNIHDSKVFEELVDAVESIKRPGTGADYASDPRSYTRTRSTTIHAVERFCAVAA